MWCLACYYMFPTCSFWGGPASTAVINEARSLTLALYPSAERRSCSTVCAFIKALRELVCRGLPNTAMLLKRQNKTLPLLFTQPALLPCHPTLVRAVCLTLLLLHKPRCFSPAEPPCTFWEGWRLSSISFAKHLDSLWGLQ